MKKALSILSAALVIMMLLSVCTLAAESDEKLAALGQKTYYTGDSFTATETMVIDGRLGDDEGWVCVTPDFVNKTAVSSEYRFNAFEENAGVEALGEDMLVYASSFKYYVAESETDIYFAIEDYAPYFENDGEEGFTKACESLSRNFYSVRLGFDTEHYDRFIHIREEETPAELDICGADGYSSIKEGYADMVEFAFARFAEDGTLLSETNDNKTNQHYWTRPAHQWVACIEFKLDKALIKEAYVEQFGEGADADIDFSSILVSASATGSVPDTATSDKYSSAYAVYGTLISKAEAAENELSERVIPDIVVFANDPNPAPATEAPATEAPATEAPADETEAPATTKASEGLPDIYDLPQTACTGTVSFGGIALVALIGSCTAFVAKKKDY